MVWGFVTLWYALMPLQLKMVSIELTKEEIEKICQMMEGSSVQLAFAEKALALYKKFKNAK